MVNFPMLSQVLLSHFGSPQYSPQNKNELARELNVSTADKATLRAALRELEEKGNVVKISGGRYQLVANQQNLVAGTLAFRYDGTVYLTLDALNPLNEKHIAKHPAGVRLFIPPFGTGTALDGDKVSAKVVTKPARALARPLRERGKEPQFVRGPEIEARVHEVIERSPRRILGTLLARGKEWAVQPDDLRQPPLLLVDDPGSFTEQDLEKAEDSKVAVRILSWENRAAPPKVRLEQILGLPGAPGLAMLEIIAKHGLRTEFPDETLREAAAYPGEINPGELEGREDCRKMDILTIDPEDARDFDDAITIARRPEGGWSVGVHIADVSYYVQPNSEIDKEALARGNSTYLADRVLPMLPEALSNELCSLKPRVDRLTAAAFMEFDAQARPISARFAKAVIHSKCRLSYEQAYAILKAKPEPAPPPDCPAFVAPMLHEAWAFARKLRDRRFVDGALALDFPEVKVVLDAEGSPVRLKRSDNDESHQLIEEFMLAANEAVAKSLRERDKPTVYRIHEPPDEEKIAEFMELAALYQLPRVTVTERGGLNRIIEAIRGRPEEQLLKTALLRSLMRARYAPDPLGHYGLAKENYTHFTSPIRRYSDLIVHRQLFAEKGGKSLSCAEIGEMAEHISRTERLSADAENASKKLKQMEYLERCLTEKPAPTFKAFVVEARRSGLMVELSDFVIRGMITAFDLPTTAQFDAARSCFFDRKSREEYRMGDQYMVSVARVRRDRDQVDFRIVSRLEASPVVAPKSGSPIRSGAKKRPVSVRGKKRR